MKLPPQKKLHLLHTWHFVTFPLPLFLLFPSLSLCGSDLRSAVCLPGERQRELSLHLSLSLVIPLPSTLVPLLTLSLSLGSWSVTTCQMPVSLPHTSSVSVQLSNEILSQLQMSEKTKMWNKKMFHWFAWRKLFLGNYPQEKCTMFFIWNHLKIRCKQSRSAKSNNLSCNIVLYRFEVVQKAFPALFCHLLGKTM